MDFQQEKTQSQTKDGAIPETTKPAAETKNMKRPVAELEME
jgi:hypothetical protein